MSVIDKQLDDKIEILPQIWLPLCLSRDFRFFSKGDSLMLSLGEQGKGRAGGA